MNADAGLPCTQATSSASDRGDVQAGASGPRAGVPPTSHQRAEQTQHELKVWPRFFDRLLDGTKTFEVRQDDRGFAVGDVLWLREWDHQRGYSGRHLRKRVVFTYRWDEDDLGVLHLNEGTIVMGLGAMHTEVITNGR